ncbi:MAG: Fe-S cluster assembly protein SufD [Gammaproteobacteria bacterium]
MNTKILREEFESQIAQLPGEAHERNLRRKAMEAFHHTGFPNRQWEAWRYTDLKPITSSIFQPIPKEPPDNTHATAHTLLTSYGLETEPLRLVFLGGHYVAALSSEAAQPGLELSTLDRAWPENCSALSERSSKQFSEHPLAALNTAFTTQGAWIRVAEKANIEPTMHLVFLDSNLDHQAPQPRILIDLKAEASLTVVKHFLSTGSTRGWTNLVTEVSQAQGSKLTLYQFQEHGTEHFHTGLFSSKLADSASIKLGYIDLGGQLTRNDIHVDLAAPGARAELFGVFLASHGQHVDNHTRIDHRAPETTSVETFRGIIGERGRGVFNGKVVVHPNAQKVDAQQRSDNLLLSEKAEIDTKPELEIYADDVKCSHGATVGDLDAEQLFYMQSRGVEDATARRILTLAFANDILKLIGLPRLRERVILSVTDHLSGHEKLDTRP